MNADDVKKRINLNNVNKKINKKKCAEIDAEIARIEKISATELKILMKSHHDKYGLTQLYEDKIKLYELLNDNYMHENMYGGCIHPEHEHKLSESIKYNWICNICNYKDASLDYN